MREFIYFKAHEIAPGIIRIIGICQEMMYLLQGKKRAVLIDTGNGVGDLHQFVRTLTSLPLTVILTHAHGDHAAAAGQFSEVYMREEDVPVYNRVCLGQIQYPFAKLVLGDLADKISPQDYYQAPEVIFKRLMVGDIFDLGDLTIEIIDGAGHTPGSVAIFLRERRSIILSDACNPTTFMFFPEALCIEKYLQTLLNIKKRSPEFDTVYISHGSGDAPVTVLDEVISVCYDILERKNLDDVPFTYLSHHAYIAKKIDTNNERVDGKCGNIFYNPNNLYPCTREH